MLATAETVFGGWEGKSDLELNLSLSNILLAAATVHDLLRLGNLGADSVRTEVLQGVPLNGVDAQGRVGLDNGKATGDCNVLCKLELYSTSGFSSQDVRKNRLVPLSSMTSTTPAFSCSIEGTWLARTPISPDSAGMLTWTASWDL